MVSWQGKEKSIPVPCRGIDDQYDAAEERVREVRDELNSCLDRIRARFGNKGKNIAFCHSKFRYEVEVPEELVKGNNKPADFEYTSARKGFQRFHTSDIKQLTKMLEDAEDELNSTLIPFICSLFYQFYQKNSIWSRRIPFGHV